MKAELITHYGDDLSPVNAARVSFDNESDWEYKYPKGELFNYKSLSEKDRKLINYLAKNKHTSCFEHQGATFRVKVPIFIARQIQRHRTFAYNEISRRYVDNAPEFFWPDKWRKRAENVKQGSSDEEVTEIAYTVGGAPRAMVIPVQEYMEESVSILLEAYNKALEAGVAPELARMILPQNMYTEFYMTGNLRNWAHFLKLRLDAHAQLEVQHIAQQVHDLIKPLFPVSVEALMKHD